MSNAVRIGLTVGVAAWCFVLWVSIAIGALVAAAGETTMQRGLALGAACGLGIATLVGALIGFVVADPENQ